RHRPRQRAPLRVRGQSAWRSGRPRGHALRRLRRAARRALRLSHSRVPRNERRPLPVVRCDGTRPLGAPVRGTGGVEALRTRDPAVYNPQFAMTPTAAFASDASAPKPDRLGRPLRNLRLSVTDRCNLRCEYCMPEDDYVWLPREDVLHFEEISALVDV